MKFWLFRTNLTNLESYHKFDTIQDFRNNLWDFYLYQALWLLENTEYEESTIWRLTDKYNHSIKFQLPNGKYFIQRFVKSFNECFKFDKPTITFFRGGFLPYDQLTKKNPKFFGLKLYLGANGPRRYPIYGGKYDKILVEDERDLKKKCIPYYKTSVPNIFKPLNLERKYDLCWSCNFTQLKFKGQEYFINQISKSDILKNLKIVHVGNMPEIGKKLCLKYKVNNIEFLGQKNRFELNEILNQSEFGIVTSNELDGCPRISTEILSSGTPLLIRDKTRLLNYYKSLDCVKIFQDNKLEKIYNKAKKNYDYMKQKNLEYLNSLLNIDKIMKMNIELW